MDPGAPVAASKLQPVTVTALRLANSQAAVATRVRANGLELSAGMSFDEWAILGHRIARVHSGSAWALGDWLLYGERSFGDRYRSAVDATNLDYQTLRNYAWVARSFESARRREGLSFQHHAEVAALSEPEQDLWLHRRRPSGGLETSSGGAWACTAWQGPRPANPNRSSSASRSRPTRLSGGVKRLRSRARTSRSGCGQSRTPRPRRRAAWRASV